uniref:Uncharacterized protein n=1 Tax=viral metagenome TaxID=1070528 RepID=A0A6M3ID36_9ZZZZ
MADIERLLLLLLVPSAILLVLTSSEQQEQTEDQPTVAKAGKETYYLEFNKDEIMKGLVATEEHFRNVSEDNTEIQKGYLNCVVKHLISVESHGDEAISHSQVTVNECTSNNFKQLRNQTRALRRDVQEGSITPGQGITRTREIRRFFESFNPEFDISRCKACSIEVELVTTI